jgi:DNA (cytosine-5)-methyltransferase 1
MPRTTPTVISLFSGALGLDLGLEQAGFEIRVAVECNRFAVETVKRNRPDLPLFDRKLEEISSDAILEKAGLEPGEPTVVTGGPSCQPFSTAGRRGSVSDPRGKMFREFCRVVREAQPEFFVLENVKGILSAAISHRPLKERGPGFPPLEPEEELGSAFVLMVRELHALGYYTIFTVLNSADYGVPQARERVLFLGSREGKPLSMPRPTHAQVLLNGRERWLTLRDALEGLLDPSPEHTSLAPKKARFLRHIPEGGNWRDLPKKLQREALGGAYNSWGGRVGFYRRLAWDTTPPAVTTRPDSKATMQCHPTDLRPLSVREYARIQGFPDDWQFSGGTPQKYLQIGNAFPVRLGAAIGVALLDARKCESRTEARGVIACTDDVLLDQLAHGARTRLNPDRMREVKGLSAARDWHGRMSNPTRRHEILKYVVRLTDRFESPTNTGL